MTRFVGVAYVCVWGGGGAQTVLKGFYMFGGRGGGSGSSEQHAVWSTDTLWHRFEGKSNSSL